MHEHDRLHAVAQVELRQDVRDVRLDGRVADEERAPDLGIERPLAISRRISVSRAVSSSISFGGAGRGLRVNCSITRLVTAGESSASPAATVRIAAISCSGGSSLRTKPLAPALSAS